jgi:hypothetical protein
MIPYCPGLLVISYCSREIVHLYKFHTALLHRSSAILMQITILSCLLAIAFKNI